MKLARGFKLLLVMLGSASLSVGALAVSHELQKNNSLIRVGHVSATGGAQAGQCSIIDETEIGPSLFASCAGFLE